MRRRCGFTFVYSLGRRLAAFGVFLCLTIGPAAAADYSPWIDQPSASSALTELAQRQDACCKHCTKGQPCGNTCISAKAKCKSPPGCAC
jgi:hypothetical protein